MYRRVSPFGRRPNDTVLVYAQLPFLSSQTAKRASEAGRVEHTIPVPFLPNSGRGGFCLRKGVEIGTLSVLYYKQTKERLGFMRYTSAEANKLLKKLNEEYAALLAKEERCRFFKAAMGEDTESVRPPYCYAETQKKLDALEAQIRTVKHAINIFNTTHTVDGFAMTVDEMLVYIPQLTKRKAKLAEMRAKSPKERVEEDYGRRSNIIDYWYINYDAEAAERDFQTVSEELSRAQLALDVTNNRETMEISL